MPLKLQKYVVKMWEEKIDDAYQSFKRNVIDNFGKEHYPEKPEEPDCELTEEQCVDIYTRRIRDAVHNEVINGRSPRSISLTYRATVINKDSCEFLEIFPQYLDYVKKLSDYRKVVEELDKQKCQIIRDTCEPVKREAEQLKELLIMQPEKEDLEHISKWCEEHKKHYEISCRE